MKLSNVKEVVAQKILGECGGLHKSICRGRGWGVYFGHVDFSVTRQTPKSDIK